MIGCCATDAILTLLRRWLAGALHEVGDYSELRTRIRQNVLVFAEAWTYACLCVWFVSSLWREIEVGSAYHESRLR
jgi:hypothetical protein